MANGYVAGGNTHFRNDLNLFFSQGLAVVFAKLFDNADPMDAAAGGPPAGPATPAGDRVAENDRLMTSAGQDGEAQAALSRHVPDVRTISFAAIKSFFACPRTPAAVKRACFHGGTSQRLSTTPPGLVSQRLDYFLLDKLRMASPVKRTNTDKSPYSEKSLKKLVLGIRSFDPAVIAGTDPKTTLAWYGCTTHEGAYEPPQSLGDVVAHWKKVLTLCFGLFPRVLQASAEAEYAGLDLMDFWYKRLHQNNTPVLVAMAQMTCMVTYLCSSCGAWLDPQRGLEFLPELRYLMEDKFAQHILARSAPSDAEFTRPFADHYQQGCIETTKIATGKLVRSKPPAKVPAAKKQKQGHSSYPAHREARAASPNLMGQVQRLSTMAGQLARQGHLSAHASKQPFLDLAKALSGEFRADKASGISSVLPPHFGIVFTMVQSAATSKNG
jgi:hypothetical protein